MKSKHQQRVEEFMVKAEQDVPLAPTVPSEQVRILRAKLIFEEAVKELIYEGLAVEILIEDFKGRKFSLLNAGFGLHFQSNIGKSPDLVAIADGCADIAVVVTGTLSACGIADERLQEIVDESNLKKFGPGGYKREDGKWIKPPDWVAPDIASLLKMKRFHVFTSTEGGMEDSITTNVFSCELGDFEINNLRPFLDSCEVGESFRTGNAVIVRVKDVKA